MAHYAGDEKPSAAVTAFIDQLLNSGDQVKISLGMSLASLWSDLPPADALKAHGVRVFGPDATVAQDLAPEYLAVSPDSLKAWVVLQENNALAEIHLNLCKISRIIPLGFKNHRLPGNGIDASDKDSAINIQPHRNVFGMYQPEGLSVFRVGGRNFLIAAKARDTNADGVCEKLYAFGGRSYSIWAENSNGLKLVFDSGPLLEEISAATLPKSFNADNSGGNSADSRSDDTGPEPEGLVFVRGDDSPTGTPLLVVANEVSGTTTIHAVNPSEN